MQGEVIFKMIKFVRKIDLFYFLPSSPDDSIPIHSTYEIQNKKDWREKKKKFVMTQQSVTFMGNMKRAHNRACKLNEMVSVAHKKIMD